MSYPQYRKTSLFRQFLHFSYRERSNADDLSGLDRAPEGNFSKALPTRFFPGKNLTDLTKI